MIENQEPSFVEGEQALLGALLVRNEALFSLPLDLRPEHFHEPLHQRIYDALCKAIERGERADALSLKNRFDGDPALADIGGGAYLAKLMANAWSLNSAPECAKSIIDLAARRKIIAACTQAMAMAHDLTKGDTAGEICAQLGAELEGGVEYGRYRVSTEKEVTERLVEKLQSKKLADRTPTGITKLDQAMDGGMFAGKLYGIVGRKKHGKTMLAGTISGNLQKSGQKHLYLALEMGSDEIHQRSMARQLGCYESAFRSQFGESNNFIGKLVEYSRTAENHRLYLDAPGLSFNDLRHVLPIYIRRHKIKGFILDCWQLVTGKPKGQSTAEHLDAVAQWLAETVKRYGVWGLVTAQENQDENTRGGEGIRLACDQLYRMCKRDESSPDVWLEMMETRYTRWYSVGNENSPALIMSDKGTHFDEAA